MDSFTSPSGLAFIKMHGAGNDFVVIDQRQSGSPMTASLARALGDRHTGVGFDQLAVIRPGKGTDFTLDFWNSDGTMAEACGNATRCVCHLIMSETGRDALSLTTARGTLSARRDMGLVSVNMGHPQIGPSPLPLPGAPDSIGMGNPHCVFFVADSTAVDLPALGPRFEHDPIFPNRTNVEFAHLIAPDHLRLRVWERGAGITLACGSGACAVAVAAHLRGLTSRRVRLALDGGTLGVDWREDGVWLTGPVARVFDGWLSPEFVAQFA
jgi:diaminopimelate epimerase